MVKPLTLLLLGGAAVLLGMGVKKTEVPSTSTPQESSFNIDTPSPAPLTPTPAPDNWIEQFPDTNDEIAGTIQPPNIFTEPNPLAPSVPEISTPAPQFQEGLERSTLNGVEIFLNGAWVQKYQPGGLWRWEGTHAHWIDYSTTTLAAFRNYRYDAFGNPVRI